MIRRRELKGILLLLCLTLLLIFTSGVSAATEPAQVVKVGFYENNPKIFTDEKGSASGSVPPAQP